MKNERRGLIVSLFAIIILLSVTCIISITYNFIGGFYYGRIINFYSLLGERQIILIDGEGAFTSSCNFSGTLILDENFKQEVEIDIREVDRPLYLRAKAYISGINYNVKMAGITNWIYAEDNYLYFNQSVKALEKVNLCKYLMFDSNLELDSYSDYIFTFVIEASEEAWNYEVV